jgi:ABC-type transport system substrate-binding protein
MVATGVSAAAAAFLAACGGSDSGSGGSSGGESKDAGSGLLFKAQDSSKTAKRGGTWKSFLVRDPQNFDLYNFDPFSQPFANTVGSKLVKSKPGFMEDPSLAVEPDVAQSWEISPDKLTVTFKLNPAAKWSPLSSSFHSGAPSTIANRQMDAEDFAFAWSRFVKTPSASGADELSNERKPEAPVASVTATDKTTVVMKLVRPFAPLLISLGNGSVSYPYFLPKEGAGDKIDFFKMQFGGGPFYIDRYEPSVRMVLKRNPNYELRDTEFKRPYVDTVELPIIPDASTVVAQYRTGALFTNVAGGLPSAPATRPLDEILQMKKEFPEMNLLALRGAESTQMWFGMRADGPWKDVRVRQAMSYAWDRDTYVNFIFFTDKLEANGIPSNIQWNTAYPAGELGIGAFKGWWLDPKSKEFGENSKYFTLGDRKKDIAEARSLLSAAGYKDGLSFEHVTYPISPSQQRPMDVIEGIIADAGFKSTGQRRVTIPQIFTDYINNGGEFKELLNTLDFGGPDPAAYFRTHMHKAGSLFGGFNQNNTGASKEGDPYANDLIEKMLIEYDEKKRISMAHDFQRHHAKWNYKPRYPGAATALALTWPAIQNMYTWRGYGLSGAYAYEWIDETKAPLKK